MIPESVLRQATEHTRSVVTMTASLAPDYAKLTKAYVDALEKEGFTRPEAIELAGNLRVNGGSK